MNLVTTDPKLLEAMRAAGVDTLLEATYLGVHDVADVRKGLYVCTEFHAFQIVKLLAGREQKAKVLYLHDEGQKLTPGRAYWLGAKQMGMWRVIS